MKIALLGDIAIFGRYCITKNKSVFRYLDKVREHLSKFDIVIGKSTTNIIKKVQNT